jgi:hypothetical protein
MEVAFWSSYNEDQTERPRKIQSFQN